MGYHQEIKAQFIEPGELMENRYPRFSARHISERSIQKISLRKMRKPSGRPIYDDGERVNYQFDEQGRMIAFELIYKGYRGRMDTTRRTYTYADDRLIAMLVQRGKYRKRIDYQLENDSTVIEQRWVSRSKGPWEFLDEEQVLTTDQFNPDGNKEVVEWISGIDAKPYKRIVSVIDKNGRPLERKVWNGARVYVTEQWSYASEQIQSYTWENRRDGESARITYPPNTEEEGEWCEQGMCRNWSEVYYTDGSPKAWIYYQEATENVSIIEFRYTYR